MDDPDASGNFPVNAQFSAGAGQQTSNGLGLIESLPVAGPLLTGSGQAGLGGQGGLINNLPVVNSLFGGNVRRRALTDSLGGIPVVDSVLNGGGGGQAGIGAGGIVSSLPIVGSLGGGDQPGSAGAGGLLNGLPLAGSLGGIPVVGSVLNGGGGGQAGIGAGGVVHNLAGVSSNDGNYQSNSAGAGGLLNGLPLVGPLLGSDGGQQGGLFRRGGAHSIPAGGDVGDLGAAERGLDNGMRVVSSVPGVTIMRLASAGFLGDEH